MAILNKQPITVWSISHAPNLINKVTQLIQASSKTPDMYGARRVAAKTLNEIFGTVWTEENPSGEEGQMTLAFVKRLVISSLPKTRAHPSTHWRDMQGYGREEASILRELESKKSGAKLKELDKIGKRKP